MNELTPEEHFQRLLASDEIALQDCVPHGRIDKKAPPRTLVKKVMFGEGGPTTVSNYRFEHCTFQGEIPGHTINDCTFEDCTFDEVVFKSIYSFGASFVRCQFRRCQWFGTVLREAKFKDCTLADDWMEASMLISCSFVGVGWNRSSFVSVSLSHCTLAQSSMSESVVAATFHECEIAPTTFDNIVDDESEIVVFNQWQTTTITKGMGQDPLEEYRVYGLPRPEQLRALDTLLASGEEDERKFQEFLEHNPELLASYIQLGHHGRYVLPQVQFGNKHVADFMVAGKNSTGHFWIALEIESPRHQVVKKNGHVTQHVQHALDQISEWRRYVANNRNTVRRPKQDSGEGLLNIDQDFKGWVIIGRDSNNSSAEARQMKHQEHQGRTHIQTWDGFRDRIGSTLTTLFGN